MFVDHLSQYRISLRPKTAKKHGFCNCITDGHTDGRTDPLKEMRSWRTHLKRFLTTFLGVQSHYHSFRFSFPGNSLQASSLFQIIYHINFLKECFLSKTYLGKSLKPCGILVSPRSCKHLMLLFGISSYRKFVFLISFTKNLFGFNTKYSCNFHISLTN